MVYLSACSVAPKPDVFSRPNLRNTPRKKEMSIRTVSTHRRTDGSPKLSRTSVLERSLNSLCHDFGVYKRSIAITVLL
jgi:hypothetical protein